MKPQEASSLKLKTAICPRCRSAVPVTLARCIECETLLPTVSHCWSRVSGALLVGAVGIALLLICWRID